MAQFVTIIWGCFFTTSLLAENTPSRLELVSENHSNILQRGDLFDIGVYLRTEETALYGLYFCVSVTDVVEPMQFRISDELQGWNSTCVVNGKDANRYVVFMDFDLFDCRRRPVRLVPGVTRIGTLTATVLADAEELQIVTIASNGCGDTPTAAFFEDQRSMPVQLEAGDLTLTIQRRKFVRGDSNQDEALDISDGIFILHALFDVGIWNIQCPNAADENDDGKIDLSDAIYLFSYLFTGGAALPPPFPEPGYDRSSSLSENTGCNGI